MWKTIIDRIKQVYLFGVNKETKTETKPEAKPETTPQTNVE
jgi:hypothetical protein